ncbi:MAG: hypothetical protein ACI4SF_07320 [Oscillospiraceae bacterium]
MKILKDQYKICNRCLNLHQIAAYRRKYCDFCGYEHFTEFSFEDVNDDNWAKKENEQARQNQASLYGNPEFSLRHYNKRLKEEQRRKDHSFYLNQQRAKNPPSGNVPKCPTCGSTNVDKISTLNRAVSIGFLGLASDKIGKQFSCKDCGYKW